jgi:hypothetical protein
MVLISGLNYGWSFAVLQIGLGLTAIPILESLPLQTLSLLFFLAVHQLIMITNL